MTGPEHYQEAERLLETTPEDDHARHHRMRVAQVHATLALAAATALSSPEDDDMCEWDRVAGVRPEGAAS